ncbi:unnamed protein product, partial [Mesorhabditis belari]|uniref:Uncharacterized protein n=1 Tax=Mesorhabditis belari TaxID=2138241 RepID=A0AAF3JC97_9BILA
MDIVINFIFKAHEPAAWFLTFVTVFLNALLFYFITCKTKHDFGIYKRILKFLTLYNIFYSTTQSVTVPILYAGDYYFTLIPGGYAMRFFSTYAQMVWGSFVSSCFGMSLAVLAVHFVYRYIQICHYRHGYLLTGYYQSIWFGYMLFCLTAWMIGCVGFLGMSIEKERLLFPDVLRAYNLNMTNRGYVGPHYWILYGTQLEPQYKDWSGMLLVAVATSSTLIMMCFCGYRTYYGMANVVAKQSAKKRSRKRRWN